MGHKVITIIVLISSPYFLVGQISKLPDEKRASAYFQLLVSKSLDSMGVSDKRQIVTEVSIALLDPKSSIREQFGNKLIRVPKEEFSQESFSIIKQAFHSDEFVNFYTIILAGQLELKETQKEMYRFIQKDSLGRWNQTFSYRSKEWAAHLALARMGVQEHTDFILSTVNREPFSSTVFFDLLKHLAYVRQKPAVDLIVEKLFSDEGYNYTPYEEPLKTTKGSFAVRTLPMLAVLVKNIPLKISSAYSMQDLRTTRAWFTKNDRKYELKEESNYAPRF